MAVESRVTQADLSLETIVLFVSDMMASRSFYEHALGLRPLAVNPHIATYAVGHLQLCLLLAAEHGVALQEGRDRSADITVMVDDFHRCRDNLAARGVRFSRTLEYAIGVTADFYDPDGHWFSLYQASETAMEWPSGPKLAALAAGRPAPIGAAGDDLADACIAYVFLFFSDPDVAAEFYGGVLGLEAIEGGPCRRVPTSAPVGVVKYDAGPTMLTTHHIESDDTRHRVATVGTGGVAMAFQVADLTTAGDALSRRGIALSGWPFENPIGRLVRFTDPAGHVFLLKQHTHHGFQRPAARLGGYRP
jgi:catechol 2,3-dioxygenase-like lactoylglutathione lyase family enzyme